MNLAHVAGVYGMTSCMAGRVFDIFYPGNLMQVSRYIEDIHLP